MRFEPNGDRVLVKMKKQAETTAGGLYVPEAARDRNGVVQGTVVAVGPGRYVNEKLDFVPTAFSPGDEVFFEGLMGVRIDLDGEEHVVLFEAQIVGKLEK